MTKYRDGSMGAADQKTYRIMCAFFTAVLLLLLLMTYTNLFHTDLHQSFVTGGAFLHVVGFILWVASIGGLWYAEEKDGKSIIAVVCIVVAFLVPWVASGFSSFYGLT